MWRKLSLAALSGVIVCAGLAALSPVRAATTDGLTVTVVNNNPDYAPDKVWVAATGNGQGAGSATLAQRSTFTTSAVSSGRVWVSLGKQLPTTPFPSPDSSDIRFDVVELTYPGVANLTAVDMYGIPMDIETFDSSGRLVAAKRWQCRTDVVTQSMRTAMAAAGGDFDKIVRRDAQGNFLRLVSPNIVSGAHPSGYPRFDAYLAGLQGQKLTIRGHAMGQDYHYTGAFAPTPPIRVARDQSC